MLFIFGLFIGTLFGMLVMSMCAVAKECDKDAKIYELRSKLNQAEWNSRPIALEGTD
tara:strand:- start:945 stop:1115 length:171 start_codon:yes stop_codon:yes gene_type:complete